VAKRKCSICFTRGHNSRTCPNKNKPVAQSTSTFSRRKEKEKELGHKLLAEKRKKVEREEIDGLVPTAGLWVVHHKRKKIAGKIVKVKRNGDIIWRSAGGASVTTAQETLIDEGYSYITDLEPEMLRWRII
jgi:hypothetical protein